MAGEGEGTKDTGGAKPEGGSSPETSAPEAPKKSAIKERLEQARGKIDEGGSMMEAAPEAEEKASSSDTGKRVREARKRVEEGGSMLESEEPAAEAEGGEETPPEAPPVEFTDWRVDDKGRLHRPDGSYATKEEVETYNAGLEGDHAEEEPTGEEAAAAEEAETPEAEAEEAGEEGASEEETEETEETPEPEVIPLRGRRDGDPPVEIEVDDPEVAEALRRSINDGMRRSEFNRQLAEVAELRDDFEAIETEIQADPTGFVLAHLPESRRVDVARQLLTDDAVFEAVSRDVEEQQYDPSKRELAKTKLENERHKNRGSAERLRAINATARAESRKVRTIVEELIEGNDLSDQRANGFRELAFAHVGKAYEDLKTGRLSEEEIVEQLRSRGTLASFGMKAKRASFGTDNARAARRARHPSPGASNGASAEGEDGAREARRVGARLKERSERRRAAAATAPGGGGPAPVKHEFPEGQGVKERIKMAKKKGMKLFSR